MRAAPSTDAVRLDLTLRVSLGDGVRLTAVLYRPSLPGAPAAVILTPYGADRHHDAAKTLAARGYAVAVVNGRGRFGSEGAFTPFENEGRDLADVVAWTAAQSWCDGRVVTFGGSYSGFAQWSMLRTPPAALVAASAAASVNPCADFPLGGNIHRAYALQWLTFVAGAGVNPNLFADRAFWSGMFRRNYMAGRAFTALSGSLGAPQAAFDTWLRHPALDDYWRSMVPDREALARIDRPILSVTGQFDADLPGVMAYHRAHLRANPHAAHTLLVGPWDHEGTRTPRRRIGGLDLGDAALVDVPELEAGWFDHHCFGRALPPLLRDPVSYFVIEPGGPGAWRGAASLAAVTRGRLSLWPSPAEDGAPGALQAEPASARAAAFLSDPTRLRPDDWVDWLDMEALQDAREIETIDGDGLVFIAEPLAGPLTLAGVIGAEVVLSCDAPDADVVVIVDALDPDGRSTPLMRAARRLRYAASLDRPRLVSPDEPVRLAFDDAAFVARVLPRGARLRFAVRALNSPWWEKNWQAGGEVARETIADARTGRLTLHLGEGATVLRLPIAAEAGP